MQQFSPGGHKSADTWSEMCQDSTDRLSRCFTNKSLFILISVQLQLITAVLTNTELKLYSTSAKLCLLKVRKVSTERKCFQNSLVLCLHCVMENDLSKAHFVSL